ncbi:unnamed protein product [Cunninghamella blakesleeana]
MQSHYHNELDHWRNTSQRIPQQSGSINRSPVPSSSHHSTTTTNSSENTSLPSDPNIKSTFIDRNSGWLESSPIQLSPSQSTTSHSVPVTKYSDNHNGDVLNAISNEDILKLTQLTKELPNVTRKHNLIQKDYRHQQTNSISETDLRSTLDHTLESQSINSNDSRISDRGLTELLSQDFMKPTPSNTEYSALTASTSYNPSFISVETDDSQYSIQNYNNRSNNNNNNAEKSLQKSNNMNNNRFYHPLSITTIPTQNNQNMNNMEGMNSMESPPLTSNSDKRRSWYKSIIKRDKKKKSKSNLNIAALNNENNNTFDEENHDNYNLRAVSMDSYNRRDMYDPSHLPSNIQLTTSLSTPKKFLSNTISIKKHLRLGNNHRRSTSVLANNSHNNSNIIHPKSERYDTQYINNNNNNNNSNNNNNNNSNNIKKPNYIENKPHIQNHGRRHSFDNFRDLSLQKDPTTSAITEPGNIEYNEEMKLKNQPNIIPSSENINNNNMNIFIPSRNVSNDTISNINTPINDNHNHNDDITSHSDIITSISSISNANNHISNHISTAADSIDMINSPNNTIHSIASLDIISPKKMDHDENVFNNNVHSPKRLQHNISENNQDDKLNNVKHRQSQDFLPIEQQQQQQVQDDFDHDHYQPIIPDVKQNQNIISVEQQQPQKKSKRVLYFDYQSLPRDDKNGYPTNVKGLVKSLVDNNHGMITDRIIKYNWHVDKMNKVGDKDNGIDIDNHHDLNGDVDDEEDEGENDKKEVDINDIHQDEDMNDKVKNYENKENSIGDNEDDEDEDDDDDDEENNSLDASKVIIGDICTVLSKDFQNIKSRKREIAEIHLSPEDDLGFTKLIQIPDEVDYEKGRLLNLYVSFFGPKKNDDDLIIQNNSVKNLCKTINDRLETLDTFVDEANSFLADRAQQYHSFVPIDDPNNDLLQRNSLISSDVDKKSLNINSSYGDISIPTSDGIPINKKVTISLPEVMTTPLPTTSSTSMVLNNSTTTARPHISFSPPPLLHSSSSLWSNFPYREYNAYEYRQEQLNDAVVDLQRGVDEFKRSLQDTERIVRAVQIDMNDTKVKMDTYLKDVPETHYSELKRLEVSIESILANKAKSRSMELFYLFLTFLLTCSAFLLWAVICVFKIGQTVISFPKKIIMSFNEYMEERNKIVKQAGMRSVAKGVDRPRSYSSDNLNAFKNSTTEILRPSHSSSTSNYGRRLSKISP